LYIIVPLLSRLSVIENNLELYKLWQWIFCNWEINLLDPLLIRALDRELEFCLVNKDEEKTD